MDTKEALNKDSETVEDLTRRSQPIGARIKEKARDFQQSAYEWRDRAAEATRNAAQSTDFFVRENPWNVIVGASVCCFVLGLLIGRSRR